jgi:hypothetical protein
VTGYTFYAIGWHSFLASQRRVIRGIQRVAIDSLTNETFEISLSVPFRVEVNRFATNIGALIDSVRRRTTQKKHR